MSTHRSPPCCFLATHPNLLVYLSSLPSMKPGQAGRHLTSSRLSSWDVDQPCNSPSIPASSSSSSTSLPVAANHGLGDCCPQGWYVVRRLRRCGQKGAHQNGRRRDLRHRPEGAEGDRERQCQTRRCFPDGLKDREEDLLLGE